MRLENNFVLRFLCFLQKVAKLPKLLLLIVLSTSQFAVAGSAVYLNDAGVALSTYDAVSYFTASEPLKGSEKFTAKYDNATYWFADEKNRDAFVSNPAKYAPQYGGYCAYAASQGGKASADPTQWTVLDGKLYVNFDARIQKQWTANIQSFIKQADTKWPHIKND